MKNNTTFSTLILFAVLLGTGLLVQGQENIRRLEEQILVLKKFIQTTERGEQAAEQGIQTIRDTTNSELELHTSYIQSQLVVNPRLRSLVIRSKNPEDQRVLHLLLADGVLQMTDGERLRAIQSLQSIH